MKRSRATPNPGNSSLRSNNSRSTPYQDPDAPSHLPLRQPHAYSERSSDSGSSFSSRSGGSMNRRNGGYQRGRGGRGRGGFSRGPGLERRHSGSSGSSNGQRPVLRAPSGQQDRATPPPAQLTRDPVRVDTPVTPSTPNKEHTSFILNGHTISETYTPSGRNIVNTPHACTSPRSIPPTRNDYDGVTPTRLPTMQRPNLTIGDKGWAHQQEYKIKVLDISKAFWTQHIYQALSKYGNVINIKMLLNSGLNNAYVTFQNQLQQNLPPQIRVEHALVRWQPANVEVRTVPSPVNPKKYYFEHNTIIANSVEFGTTDARMSMISMHMAQARGQVRLKLDLERKELGIQFPQQIGLKMREFRFELPIALLSHIYKDTNCAPGQTAIIIPFESPPRFFVRRNEGEVLPNGNEHTSFCNNETNWNDRNTWHRETDVVGNGLKMSQQDMPLMNHKDKTIIDIGRWTTYRFLLDDIVFTKPQFIEFADALADHGVDIKDCPNYTIKNRIASPVWTLVQEEISGTHPHLEPLSTQSGFDDLFAGQTHLTFPVRYQLEACLSNGYLKEHRITAEFLEKLASLDPRRAMYVLEKVVDKQQIHFDPMDIFKIRVKGSLDKKVPGYCILQRSAIITPTSIHVASPIMETSNRITRKYAADADRFLRVKFSDEKTEGVLRSMPNGRAVAPFDRVRRAMKNGIVVAGRYYEFLAFGNSQFREHGAYFYAPTSSKSADDIRLSLGKFDHIKTVAKFGARIGQCFSTTRAMRVKVTVVKIADIERNKYCFTDGVGKLSLFLAQMAAQELGLSNAFDDPPSLYQFRLGGCKGVLALDPKITGSEVHIRPSQLKFEAVFTGLEIIRSSALATPFFNRQIIVVLSNLGVCDHVLIRKQQEMVNDYEQAMLDEETAVQKLRKHIDMNQTTLTMAGMVFDGFMKSREPFMMSLLKLWRASTIKNLKEKARIAIEDGAFVLGTVDETATLKGHSNDPQCSLNTTREEKLSTLPEIFLQVDDTNKKGGYKIVEGICVLARNPSLHPGDLRIVRAVDVPALHHLKNVVVLPQLGDRDLANMCSGGDLDGDDYMVLWDVDLLPDIINVPPMDFTPEMPVEKEEPITVADISDFFVTYMQNDSLGQIAHAHLAQADQHGVNSETCLELAKLHSQAVDYPKSGIAAQMSHNLRPGRWPHFMEKKHINPRKIYKSTNILGKLYDQVELVDFKPQWENHFDQRILDAFQLGESLLMKAAEIKELYDEAFKRLMAKHGIRTEFEAWSVFVLAHNQESRDYKFAEEFGRTMSALKAQYKDLCREAAGMTSTADWDSLGSFVAAMYAVTAREMQAALSECRQKKTVGGQDVPARLMNADHMPLMSFPWLFPSELGKIATGSSVIRQVESLSYAPLPNRKKHAMKHSVLDCDTVGPVESEEGVTHYGELLSLDFGVGSTQRFTGNQFTEEEENNADEKSKKKGRTTSPTEAPGAPDQPLDDGVGEVQEDKE